MPNAASLLIQKIRFHSAKFFEINAATSLQISQLLQFSSTIVISVFMSKLLPTNEIGRFESLRLIYGTFSFFFVAGATSSLLSFFHNYGNQKNRSQSLTFKKEEIIFNASFLFIIFGLILFFLFFFFDSFILKIFSAEGASPYLKSFSYFLMINTPAFIIEYILLANEKNYVIIKYSVGNFLLQTACAVTPLLMGYSIPGSINGLIIYSILKFSFLIFILYQNKNFSISAKIIKSFLVFSVPLMLTFLVTGAAPYIDGIIISYFFDESKLAIYRYGARQFPLTTILASGLAVSLIPSVAAKYSEGKLKEGLQIIKEKSAPYYHLLFPVSIILILFSKYFFPVIFNKDFSESAMIFNIYLLLIANRLVFAPTILTAIGMNRVLFVSSLIEMLIKVVFSILLLPYLGIAGAAYGSLIADFLNTLFLIAYLYTLKIKLQDYVNIRLFILYLSLICLAFIISLFLF